MIARHPFGDRAPRIRERVLALSAPFTTAVLAALTACHAPGTRATAPAHAPPPETHEPVNASYDWHGLIIAPFGSVLNDVPATLHEVLLFRDKAHGADAAAAGEAPVDAECYAAAAPAPR